ncbi:glycosyltransferase [Paenibacillus rhizophilus]|uniref:Glycosyltransferase n=1 Tax=Paenibacillus rhizophilus TaxID=1850366 RepID=A0A3N9PAA3_9BACL|nr:glycosyltransferase [Paenibacillus rhizophilus]RQW12430.1 glycosyltransferase [Paenibacillus rhizophilus]
MIYDSFCVGIIFYNPTKEQIQKVRDYSKIVDKIYIYDNSEGNVDAAVLELIQRDYCEYLGDKRNDGISIALNYLCNKAIQDRYKYILLMDQDSIFDLGNMTKLFEVVSNNSVENIGVFSPKSTAIRFIEDIDREQKNVERSPEVDEVSWSITSGSVIDLKIFNITGGFDENLFIDKVDYDYCINIKSFGYKTVVVQNSLLYQFLGEPTAGIINYYQHNYIRHYYMFRNRLYILDKYQKNKLNKVFHLVVSSLKHIGMVLLLESSKIKKINAMRKGFFDYRNRKMGKCSHY